MQCLTILTTHARTHLAIMYLNCYFLSIPLSMQYNAIRKQYTLTAR